MIALIVVVLMNMEATEAKGGSYNRNDRMNKKFSTAPFDNCCVGKAHGLCVTTKSTDFFTCLTDEVKVDCIYNGDYDSKTWWGIKEHQDNKCCVKMTSYYCPEPKSHLHPKPTTGEATLIEQILKAESNLSYLDSNKFIN